MSDHSDADLDQNNPKSKPEVKAKTERNDLPAWARKTAFPPHGQSSPYGGIAYEKGKALPCENLEELSQKAESTALEFVWTPESDHLIAAEEASEIWPAIRKRRLHLAQEDRDDAFHKLKWGSAILAIILFFDYQKGILPWDSMNLGIGFIFLLIFGLVPWYEAQKSIRLRQQKGDEHRIAEVAESRFESWLTRQKIFGTFFLLALIGVCYLIQATAMDTGKGIISGILQPSFFSIQKAGTLKPLPTGESWRLFTGTFLHGNLLHILMNGAGLLYLGRRTEVLVRWPHLFLVYFTSLWLGALFTLNFLPGKPSVGASGGLMGLLGFLLVFESFHKTLVPKPARRRLCAALAVTFLMGVFGYQFIDNMAKSRLPRR